MFLYSYFNLCRTGILSNSTHFISLSLFVKIAIETSAYLVHQRGGCLPLSFVISKVMISHENALYWNRLVPRLLGATVVISACRILLVQENKKH